MPRKALIRSSISPYHVTLRCNNKEPFPVSLDKVWKIFSIEINALIEIYEVKIHAFVLMPNHIHLLITTPKDDLGVVMQKFISSLTKHVNWYSGRTGRVFGARYHWSMINSIQYYDSVLKYVYRNPVKAKLCEKVEHYPYSSLTFVLQPSISLFQIVPANGFEFNIPNNRVAEFLGWLNQSFKNEEEIAIKDGFRKPAFIPPKNRISRKVIELEGFK